MSKQAETLLRLPAVKARVGLGRSSIYTRMAEGKFPEAVKLGERAVAWTESSISKWIADRVKQSPQGSRNGAA